MADLIFILLCDFGCRELRPIQPTGFGNTPSVAVCESGERDRHDACEWTFVIVGLSKREVESQCSQMEEKIERIVDARIMTVEREFI